MDKKTVKVGILHSLSGNMAIGGTSLKDAGLMAIAEINSSGGVLGQIIEPVIEDGASHPATFTRKARKLLKQDQVATIFGGWTSASRKAVLPVFEELNALLWYPVEYEGLECSQHVFYTGTCPNQQVVPAVNWLLQNKGKAFYLLGSDYVFPHAVNRLIKAQLKRQDGTLLGEEYVPLGILDFRATINRIKQARPSVVFSTINGNSNLAFYQQYRDAGITAAEIPIMAISVNEEEIRYIGGQTAAGHYATWSYFQSVDTPQNHNFVRNFQARYGPDRVTSAPIEAAYMQVYLWKQAVEQAQSFEVEQVRACAYGQSFEAPEGLVRIEQNNHLWKSYYIGQILANGQFQVVSASDGPIKPQPWLGVEDWHGRDSPVVIDMLAEFSQSIQYNCQLTQKTREVEEALAQLIAANENLQHTQATEQTKQLQQALETLKETQAHLIQREKMSSLGQMVAGVAHEINNPISFIYGNLQHAYAYTQDLLKLLSLYQKHHPQPVPEIEKYAKAIDLNFVLEDLPKVLTSMKIGADRIRQIVLSLRNFSRLDQTQMKPFDIHEGIDSTLLILQSRTKANGKHPGIEIKKEYGNLPLVECYPGQINQVFMNILSNAIDALETSVISHPSLVVSGHSLINNGRQQPLCIRIQTEVMTDNSIVIKIVDNGPGMTETVRKQLFNPFFTTKPVGKGTGLGLSISHQIVVEKHRGMLSCESIPGQGTEFLIELPIGQNV